MAEDPHVRRPAGAEGSDADASCPDARRWWRQGHPPDYRFSLANERTFLAWIRTALALIAGATAVHQFAHNLGTLQLRSALTLVLFAAGAVLAGAAYRRWMRVEHAMRLDRDLPLNPALPFIAAFAVLLAAALTVLVVYG